MGVSEAPAVRVRIAPSPTGFAHLGTASTALYNVLFARQRNGTFALRVDDTDVERNRPEYELLIYEALRWLGLDWDEGPDKGGPYAPYRQSERVDLYKQNAVKLLAEGKAYKCYCTPEELDAERRQAQAERRPYKYSRRCLIDPPKDRTEFAVRFKVPGGKVNFTDMIRGEMTFDADLIGDFIVMKSDGYPTYQFASPVDDALMKITHVIRGEEHLSNTPYQLMIIDALGYERPAAYAHMPLILAKDGAKLSKRKHPEANLALYREKGYLPEAMINYLALLGWNPGTQQEIFTFDELVRVFSFDRVQHAGARFDWEKLNWINGEWIRSLDDAELARRLQPFLPKLDAATIAAAVPALKTRMTKFSDATALLEYLWTDPTPPTLDSESIERISAAAEALKDVAWEPSAIHERLMQVVEASGQGPNKTFMPLRLAVTGKKISPPIDYTLALLPEEVAMERIRRVLGT
ncbi:MAG: glutamate--tRNA ligase [Actinobacteria bacterium 13_1_40CM_4_65_12]|nr:MAG: glutamate--tRNA ligase [Chloroflexi bacterium 13_1_40CM_65_17]OLC68462.1 MAG: glutamate--tRNA ligase [Actinobacteria bacterium 13_1_40CM_4_65_12]